MSMSLPEEDFVLLAEMYRELVTELKKHDGYCVSTRYQSGHNTRVKLTCLGEGTHQMWEMDESKHVVEQLLDSLELIRQGIQIGDFVHRCHCGRAIRVSQAPGDGPTCPKCGCYTTWTLDDCLLERAKRYPYLESVDTFMKSVSPQKDSYVRLRVGKQFNLTKDEVETTLSEIERMHRDMDRHAHLSV